MLIHRMQECRDADGEDPPLRHSLPKHKPTQACVIPVTHLWMSMSSTKWLSVEDLGRAERISNGRPVVILDQIRAIFAPSPNLPRVCGCVVMGFGQSDCMWYSQGFMQHESRRCA